MLPKGKTLPGGLASRGMTFKMGDLGGKFPDKMNRFKREENVSAGGRE